jgi:hypothetical protein
MKITDFLRVMKISASAGGPGGNFGHSKNDPISIQRPLEIQNFDNFEFQSNSESCKLRAGLGMKMPCFLRPTIISASAGGLGGNSRGRKEAHFNP